MSLQRTPPTASKSTLVHGQSLSESDLTSASTPFVDKSNITVRNKRQRTEYPSPISKEEDYVSSIALDSFKVDLLDMLTKWKNEHDQLFTTWKTSQDAILSRLADDVSDLKKQFLSIKTTNSEIERGMNFINKQYEDVVSKVAALEKEKAEYAEINSHLQIQIQDLHFQSRQATIEIRNIPPKEKEAPEDLVSLVSSVGKVVNMDIQASALRDIYRVPGKPGLIRPIVAEFHSVHARNDLLANVRKFNKERSLNEKLNTKTIGIAGDKRPIYVDGHLPPSMRKLLYDSRQFARANNFSCWWSNGKVLMRRDAADKPIEIKSEKCLTRLTAPK